jgi:hypothetical protein
MTPLRKTTFGELSIGDRFHFSRGGEPFIAVTYVKVANKWRKTMRTEMPTNYAKLNAEYYGLAGDNTLVFVLPE